MVNLLVAHRVFGRETKMKTYHKDPVLLFPTDKQLSTGS